MELMGVLIVFTGWVGVVEHTIDRFVFDSRDNFLPGTEETVDSRVSLLKLLEGFENGSVDFTDGVLGRVVRLNVSGRDGHAESNFEHVTSILGSSVGKSVLVGGLPGFHDRVTFNLKVSFGDDGVFLVGNFFTKSLISISC